MKMSQPFKISKSLIEMITIFCSLAIASYIGAYIRLGIGSLKVWSIDVNYMLMLAQVLGSFIMGMMAPYKNFMMVDHPTLFHRCIYMSIATGLCGSITSFSSWAREANKNFVLQWDYSYGNIAASYNGGRFFEWVLSMWGGVVLPLSAYRFGKYCSQPIINPLLAMFSARSHFTTPYVENVDDTNDIDEEKNDMDDFVSNKKEATPTNTTTTSPMMMMMIVADEDEEAPSTPPADEGDQQAIELSPSKKKKSKKNSSYQPVNNNHTITEKDSSSPSTSAPSLFVIIDDYMQLIYMWEFWLFAFYFLSTLLIISLSTTIAPVDSYFAYIAVFGSFGTYLRFQLAILLNAKNTDFPYGTFAANMIGTAMVAILLDLSLFVTDYEDYKTQNFLLGLSYGFCGCLTTMSTFVAEIDSLSDYHGYVYAASSMLSAQVILLFIYDIYAFQQVASVSMKAVTVMQPISQCHVNHDLCAELLAQIACPQAYIVNIACTIMNDDATFIGQCACGKFLGNRVTELMIDSQVNYNFSATTYAVWPRDAAATASPTEVIDFCLSYERSCSMYLDRVACPDNLRVMQSCSLSGGGVSEAVTQCKCGGNHVPGDRIKELIIDYLTNRRYDLFPYTGYSTVRALDLCEAFTQACDLVLDHVQCPAAKSVSIGCDHAGNYSTWQGVCSCGTGTFDASVRVAEDIYDALMKYYVRSLFVKVQHSPTAAAGSYVVSPSTAASAGAAVVAVEYNLTTTHWDACASYTAVCTAFLDYIGCAQNLRQVYACGASGLVQHYNGTCHCGTMQLLNDRSREIMIDNLLLQTINEKYTYLPPSQPAYTLAIKTTPYTQALHRSTVNGFAKIF